MSYTKTTLGPRGRSTLDGLLDTASSALDAAKYILEDPALPKITYSVVELHSLEQRGAKPGTSKPGIGLNRFVTPLQTYVKMRRNPIIGYAALAGIVSIPVMIGYILGKGRRRA